MPEQANPIAQQLAAQLRDVHLPDSVGWWPLAWGWWLVLGLVVVTVLVLGVYFVRRLRANRYRMSALQHLERVFSRWKNERSDTAYLAGANSVFKRVMIGLDQGESVVKSGAPWVESLNSIASIALSDDAQTALAYECYAAKPNVDIDALHPELIAWLKTHRRPKATATSNQTAKTPSSEELELNA